MSDAAAELLGEGARALRCPSCGGTLELAVGEVLVCGGCAARYPVVDGTPRLLAAAPRPAGRGRGRAAHGAQLRLRVGALRRSARGVGAQLRRLPAAAHAREPRRQDACSMSAAGSGRHSFHAAAAGAQVVAVDLGDAIDVARRNLPPSVLTVQADAEALPFEPGSFDLVMSIGVLHHLPDTERALGSIARYAKPGGHVHVYLYWVPERRWHRAVLRARRRRFGG